MRFFFLCIFCWPLVLSAQTDQEQQLAYQYLNEGAWEKALGFFDRFHNQYPENQDHFKAYLRCLNELNQTETALETARKQEKAFPSEPLYKAYYYALLLKTGDLKKAEKEWDRWLKSLPPFPETAENWGNAFVLLGFNQKAIELYLFHRQKFKDDILLHFKLAEAYAATGNYAQLADELIGVLQKSPGAFGQVQAAINNLLTDDKNDPVNQAIKSSLLRSIQQPGDHREEQELLLWIHRQEGDFAAAFVQARALDVRYKEQGARLMDLGRAAALVQEFNLANKCFAYVVDLGPGNAYYIDARVAKVNNLEAQLSWEGNLTGTALNQLADAYQKLLSEIGPAPQSMNLHIDLARLEAFELGQVSKAKKRLDSLLNLGRGSAKQIAGIKLNLADVQLLLGDLWEPSLLYGQIEKAYPNLEEAQEAKFRNARLAYFRGEFPWAQTQAKVLKASTSKLIANDALRLSLLIQDNGGADSVYDALNLFARAELALYQQNLNLAEKTLDSLKTLHPNHSLMAHLHWIRFQMLKKNRKNEAALDALDALLAFDSNHLLADDALLEAGKLLEQKLDKPEEAMEKYRLLLMEHPSSIWTTEARKRYRMLRGDHSDTGF